MSQRFDYILPRYRIELACAQRGREEVVAGCVALLYVDEVDPSLLIALAGPGAVRFIDGPPRGDTYWLRVWGARGLLWAWDAGATDALLAALTDEAWRVREMALKVVARYGVVEALTAARRLTSDPVRRVREAATKAVARLETADP